MPKVDTACDTPEQIAQCLSCTRPRCTNCYANDPRRRPPRKRTSTRRPGRQGYPVEQVSPVTGEVVAVYPGRRDAGAAVEADPHKITYAIRAQTLCAGYLWRNAKE